MKLFQFVEQTQVPRSFTNPTLLLNHSGVSKIVDGTRRRIKHHDESYRRDRERSRGRPEDEYDDKRFHPVTSVVSTFWDI